LLVDDEKFITKGLRAIIERSDTSFKDIHECMNGKEALEKIRQEKFDLVITDIRMPGMDGLLFMKEAQNAGYIPKFIILSGYDDFHYAREGMSCGAKAYLLKPVKRSELLEALSKVEFELRKEENLNLEREKFSSLMDKFRENELKSILHSESMSEPEISNTIETIKLDILKKEYYVCLLARQEQGDGLDKGNYYMPLRVHVEDCFRDEQPSSVVFISIEDSVVIISDSQSDFEKLLKYLIEKEGGRYAVVLSERMNGAAQVRKAYMQCREAIKYKLVWPVNEIIRYCDISMLRKDYAIPLDSIKKIAQIIGTNRIKEVEGILNEIFDRNVLCRYHISYLERIVSCVNQFVIQYFREYLPQKAEFFDKYYELLKDIYNFNNMQEYLYALKNYIFEVNDFLLAIKDVYKDKDEIDKAIGYVYENYNKDLNMAVVANHVSLNYSYFSFLFREQTGLSFVDFLKKVRIEKSKELLKDPGFKIADVSHMVGYKDVKYFTRNFRELVGISPLEYRNRLL